MIRHRAILAGLGLLLAAGGARAQTADALFDPAVVQDVRLYVHAADWRALQAGYLENTYYPADLVWRGVRVHNVGIRSRGFGSRDGRKPGLKVDINHFVSGQRFLGLRAFVLDNGLQDDSLLKERLVLGFFERLGHAVPREAPARLYINNYYWGAYVLVESVDAEFLSRVAPAQTAGAVPYLFEYRWTRPYELDYLGEDPYAYADLFEPRTHETESAEVLYGPLRELTRQLVDVPDEGLESAVEAYLDLDQFVRAAAIENFVADIDGLLGAWGMNNFYLYRTAASTRASLVPWDKDSAFNDAWHPLWFNVEANALMRRAMALPRLRALYLDTLLACADLAASPSPSDSRGWLEREIESGMQQVTASVEADRTRPRSFDAFLAEAERLTAFARTRSQIVVCEVAAIRGEPPPESCEPR